jgi:hypothetical protein
MTVLARTLEVVKVLSEAQAQLGREIIPVVMAAYVFIAQQVKGGRVATRVMDEPKIFVMGNADDLANRGIQYGD